MQALPRLRRAASGALMAMFTVMSVLVTACLPSPALAATATSAPPEVARELPNARLLGSGRLTVMLFHVYDARLWVRDGFSATDASQSPLALELEYARTLEGAQIAARSIVEMKRIGEFGDDTAQRWLASMKQIFIDVKAGDRLTGLQLPGQGARFFLNGKPAGEVRDAEFTRLFFGIWLSPRSSQPALRDALLGARRPAS